jgi:hypothetical protein
LRAIRLLMILVASLLVPSACYAKGCPSDLYKAGKEIWTPGTLTYGSAATAVHPCGRKITCIGGKFNAFGDPQGPGGVPRKCYWH